MDLLQYVAENMLILIGAVYGFGMIIKRTEKIKDKYIPVVLTVVSLVLSVLWVGFVLGEGFTPAAMTNAVVQALLIVSVAVFTNQTPKQLKKDE